MNETSHYGPGKCAEPWPIAINFSVKQPGETEVGDACPFGAAEVFDVGCVTENQV